MYWNDLPCNELLNRVFCEPPKIGLIDIFDIELKRDGPSVIINFDLVNILPDNPPAKWGRDFNRCRMGVYCTGISDISIVGLETNILANIFFEIIDDKTKVTITSDKFNMGFKCTDISVTGPSVYISN